ncbi:hypothetical protein CEXT_642321 [Caerostris extrusa]|uniref:Uncharacterized protein n=1 Tax=Caerostris extrusa TaxID=172846 RepID=A0AAV4V8G2_CAEEX|nr:hypothetical protein CEXT_642321 [Caerostris extrusa]
MCKYRFNFSCSKQPRALTIASSRLLLTPLACLESEISLLPPSRHPPLWKFVSERSFKGSFSVSACYCRRALLFFEGSLQWWVSGVFKIHSFAFLVKSDGLPHSSRREKKFHRQFYLESVMVQKSG